MDNACLRTTLRQAAHAGTGVHDRPLAPSGQTVTMFRLLPRISTFPEGTIKDRAGAVGRDRSTLGRTLRVVERQGRVTLGSTEAGRAALAGARPMWDAAQARMKAAMGADPNGVPARLERIAALPSDTGARAP